MKINEIELIDTYHASQLTQIQIHGFQELLDNGKLPFEFMHKVDDMTFVNVPSRDALLIISDDNKVEGFCTYSNLSGKANLWKIREVVVFRKHYGKSYGFMFYYILLFKLKFVLSSYGILMKGGQKVWGRMMQDPRIMVVAAVSADSDTSNPASMAQFVEISTNIDDRMLSGGNRMGHRLYAAAANNIPDWMNDRLIEPGHTDDEFQK